MHVDVDLSTGTVRGMVDDGNSAGAAGSAVFRGIPFASLPVRFGPPEAARSWSGPREALAFGPPPPQSAAGGAGGPAVPAGPDEWLTVNVWSPDVEGHLPVMVWIQGGAYLFGTSGLPEYDGRVLAAHGVVLVTFNYRVGFEGFGLVEGRPANRGLLDQVALLEWVRENIAAFGGDPASVTVFGESAGAGSVAALLAMPRAQGLFQRAIAQSVPGTYFTPSLAADVTRVCAAELGVEPDGLDAVPPHLLPPAVDAVQARIGQYAGRWGLAAYASIPLAPVVDGEVLPTTPWRGLTGSVPLLVGHTRHEQRLLSALTGVLGHVTPAQADETAARFGPDPQRYREAFVDPEELYDVVRSDWLFRMPSLRLAEAQHAAGGVAHLYELTWEAPGMGGILGACHGLDVPLVFGNLTVGRTALLVGEPGPEATAVSRQMREAWTGFAASGDPGWPRFDPRPDSPTTRLFDVEPAVTAYPEVVSRAIWTDDPGVLDLA